MRVHKTKNHQPDSKANGRLKSFNYTLTYYEISFLARVLTVSTLNSSDHMTRTEARCSAKSYELINVGFTSALFPIINSFSTLQANLLRKNGGG